VLRRQACLFQHLVAAAVGQELLRQAEGLHRHVHVVIAQQPGHRVAEPAGPPVVLHGDHQPVLPRRADQRLVHRLGPARVHHGDADPVPGQPVRDLQAGQRHHAGADEQDVRAEALGRRAEHVHAA
jgi:hypothetical protein